ncbi:MAG: hypothetical protein Q8P67_04660 [archaeon]|nr:hypothetical protein [archaeon]
MDWDEEEQGPSFDEHEEEEQQPPKPKRQRGTTGGRSKQHKSQKQLRREAEEEEERRRAEEKEKESWGPTRRKELMPYPVLSQADESATPFTPFARSIKAPVLLAELEAHAGEVKAHIEQANNPAAPTAVDQSHILHHAIRKERWEAEKSKRDKEKRRLRKERKRQREMAVDQLMREQGMAKAQAQAIVDASKAVPRTTESMRVYTETLVAGDDAEALAELQQDEMSSYFDSPEGLPKVLITSSISPSNRMRTFMNELQEVIPSSRWYDEEDKKHVPVILFLTHFPFVLDFFLDFLISFLISFSGI